MTLAERFCQNFPPAIEDDVEGMIEWVRDEFGWSREEAYRSLRDWARGAAEMAAVFDGLREPRQIARFVASYSRARVWATCIGLAAREVNS